VRTLVVTGCAGRVAAMIAPHLRQRFRLRGLDVEAPMGDVTDEFIAVDVREIEAVAASFAGADAVLHLAAQPAEADFRERLLPRNLDATWAVYEAAVRVSRREALSAVLDVPFHLIMAFSLAVSAAGGEASRDVSFRGILQPLLAAELRITAQ